MADVADYDMLGPYRLGLHGALGGGSQKEIWTSPASAISTQWIPVSKLFCLSEHIIIVLLPTVLGTFKGDETVTWLYYNRGAASY